MPSIMFFGITVFPNIFCHVWSSPLPCFVFFIPYPPLIFCFRRRLSTHPWFFTIIPTSLVAGNISFCYLISDILRITWVVYFILTPSSDSPSFRKSFAKRLHHIWKNPTTTKVSVFSLTWVTRTKLYTTAAAVKSLYQDFGFSAITTRHSSIKSSPTSNWFHEIKYCLPSPLVSIKTPLFSFHPPTTSDRSLYNSKLSN